MTLHELGWLQYTRKHKLPSSEQSGNTSPLNKARTETTQPDEKNIGRVSVENKTNFVLQTAEGELQGIIQGKFRHATKNQSDFPKVGDWVVFEKLRNEDKAIIKQVLPRYSMIARKSAGESTAPQIIASNVDSLFIVYGLDKPFNAPLIERYLSMAYEGGVEPIIILNKTDSAKSVSKLVKDAEALSAGLTVHAISARNKTGMSEVEALVEPGRTIAFVGPSGVGKSTIINNILGSEVQATGEVRLVDSKGRHTTTRREMFTLPHGGILIDTPGIRELETLSSEDSVATLFSDIEKIVEQCRFKDCDHVKSKNCAVVEALKSGAISKERYNSFLKLKAEAEQSQNEDVYKRLDRKRAENKKSNARREAGLQRKPQRTPPRKHPHRATRRK